MSLTVFLAFCVLGCDFLLYVLFQWTYGEKRRKYGRRLAARQKQGRTHSSKEVEAAKLISFPQRLKRYQPAYSDRAMSIRDDGKFG